MNVKTAKTCMYYLLLIANLNNLHLATNPSSNTNLRNSSLIIYYLLDSLLSSTFAAFSDQNTQLPKATLIV